LKYCTEAQIKYYKYLCEQAYVEPDDDYENMTAMEMSEAIAELKVMVGGYAKTD
jgi:hypothetical protein